MIVTLTLHPSLDRTIALDGPLAVGEVQLAQSVREDAGGKGINVARVVAAADVDSRAVLPLAETDPFAPVLARTGLTVRPVPVAGRVRTNLAITDPEGVTTKVNLPGAVLDESEIAALIDTVTEVSADARWLVLAGSLPPQASADLYVRIVRAVRTRLGARAPLIAVDTSGAALAAVVEAADPDLIKPNDEELAELTGLDLDGADRAAIASAVTRIVPSRARAALITLGGDGALLVTAEGVWSAQAPRIVVASTVGAGDSALAGYLLAEHAGLDPAERLAQAIRYGAAAAMLAGTQAPRPDDLPAVIPPVTVFDPA